VRDRSLVLAVLLAGSVTPAEALALLPAPLA
jgi:hypothetical protein